LERIVRNGELVKVRKIIIIKKKSKLQIVPEINEDLLSLRSVNIDRP